MTFNGGPRIKYSITIYYHKFPSFAGDILSETQATFYFVFALFLAAMCFYGIHFVTLFPVQHLLGDFEVLQISSAGTAHLS